MSVGWSDFPERTIFKDVTLPEKAEAKCFRYFDRDKGRMQKFSVLEWGDESFYLRETAETQFMRLLGLSVRALEQLPWEERDRLLGEAFGKRKTDPEVSPIILRLIDHNAYAVVTSEFVPIPHSEVWGIAESCMDQLTMGYRRSQVISLTDKTVVKYLFTNRFCTNGIATGLFISNSAKGLASLSFGAYYEILVCSNGLVSTKEEVIYSQVHRGDKVEILEEFKRRFYTFLGEIVPLDLRYAKEKTIWYPEDYLANLSIAKKYQRGVLEELSHGRLKPPREVSIFEMVNALSRISRLAPARTRLDIEQKAYNILTQQGKERK